jgi:hypothetical protein
LPNALADEVGTAVDEPGVELHERGAGRELFLCIFAAQDAARANQRDFALELGRERRKDCRRAACGSALPDNPPASFADARPSTPSRVSEVFVAISASIR